MYLVSWLKNYIKHPLVMGSILPTSGSASKLMAKDLVAPEANLVLELGSGTGAITQALLRKGVLEENLVLVEINQEFCNILEGKYPKATVLCMGALDFFKNDYKFSNIKFDVIVSGLPLVSMGTSQSELICDLSIRQLNCRGHFVQVTYFLKCPFPKTIIYKYKLIAKLTGFTLLNFPPAFVWDIRT